MVIKMSSGSIRMVIGCMFSGKTSEVIKEFNRWKAIGKKAICINYFADNRYGNDDNLYNHDMQFVCSIKVAKLADIDVEIIKSADIILINEGQFFSDIVEQCVLWCDEYHKDIIVSGLDGDFLRRPFGKILDLIPYADYVEKTTAFCARCKDGTPAPFTCRLSKEHEQIVIGTNNYIAVCRKHYNEIMKK